MIDILQMTKDIMIFAQLSPELSAMIGLKGKIFLNNHDKWQWHTIMGKTTVVCVF